MKNRLEYFRRVTAIHDEAARRLIESKDVSLDELASFFEDIGKFYSDISDDIRAKTILGSESLNSLEEEQSISPPLQKERLVEDLAG